MLEITPAVAELLLDDESNSNVKLLLVGGEACIQGLETKADIFINGYGPTECSIWATSGNKSSTIGKPLPNVTIYIVNPDDGTLCPPGVSGEIWIGGIGVSEGYHNRPELTAEKFIPNPFSSSGKVYKTGDRAMWDENGEIRYLGRFDHQVKLRGYRIELGEIQAEIERYSQGKGALVLVHEEKLVAFVASGLSDETANEAMEGRLMGALKSDDCPLTSYMVPWKIIVVDEFPLTPNGKVDRKSLLELLMLHSDDVSSLVAPETETQSFLCDLFKELLNLHDIGIDCIFAEKGGHSLLVMQAVTRIQKNFRIECFSPRHFIEFGSARGIALYIDDITSQVHEKSLFNECKGHATNSCSLGFDDVKFDTIEAGKFKVEELVVKGAGVFVLFASIFMSMLPSNIMLSVAWDLRAKNGDNLSSYYFLAFIGIFASSIIVFMLCITAFGWIYCKLLHKWINFQSKTIRRGSFYYALWYVFDRLWFVINMVTGRMFGGTVFYAWVYKAFGADIGKWNFFEDVQVRLPFMLLTGDCVAVEAGAKLETIIEQSNGDIIIDFLILEDNVVVGPNSYIGLGAHLGASSVIKPLSMVSFGSKTQDETTILGCSRVTEESTSIPSIEDEIAPISWHMAYFLASHIPYMCTALCTVGIFVGTSHLLVGFNVHRGAIFAILFVLLPLASFGPIFGATCAWIIRQILNSGQAQPGWSKLYSKSFLKQRLASQVYQSTIASLGDSILSRLASNFIFGTNIDVNDIFTTFPEEPNLTFIGKNVFCANGVKLRNCSFYPGGWVHYGTVEIGDESIILDRSVVGPDTKLEKGVMLGSITSVTCQTNHSPWTVLLGVPPLQLVRTCPENTKITGIPLVHSLLLDLSRIYFDYIVDFFAILPIYSNAIIWVVCADQSLVLRLGITFAALPICSACAIISLLLTCLVVKKLLVGSYSKYLSQGVLQVGSWSVLKWILSNMFIHEACGMPLLLVNEFWLTAFFWKMMGATIGNQTKIDPDVLMLEADVLVIGDNCRIEQEATLLCHKFNNGGLEIAPIVVPSNTSIGSRAVILPGSEILDEHVTLLPLTSVAPGVKLNAGTWQGSPAEKADIESGVLPVQLTC
uniref:AMP-dependent synthetase/ligase domain-containing protein n=1 Tax=Trieres chinensis TaxID=1514140 RepID=A0A7S1ZVC4_TRICV|mmetsp:Transcript_33403/g.68188  ORF Transcript_33403/g.68188 Transcript_33403/m.68188 type:complete len:1101 (+) Transcript_33403:3-3305(+)